MGNCGSNDDTKNQNGSKNQNRNDNDNNNANNNLVDDQPSSSTRPKVGRFGRGSVSSGTKNGSSSNNEPINPNSSNNNNSNGKNIDSSSANNNNQAQNNNGNNTNNNVASTPQKRKVDYFLESIVPSFCEFVRSRRTSTDNSSNTNNSGETNNNSNNNHNSNQSQKLLKIFMKTVANYVHSTQRASLDEARRIIFGLDGDFASCDVCKESSLIEERCTDEGLYRCLETWNQHNPTNQPLVDRETALTMAKELDNISPSFLLGSSSSSASSPSKKNNNNNNNGNKTSSETENQPTFSFGKLCSWYYDSACLPTTLAVYEKVQRDATALVNAIAQSNNNNSSTASNNGTSSPKSTINNNNNNNNNNNSSDQQLPPSVTSADSGVSRRTSNNGTPPPSPSPNSTSSASSLSVDIAMVQLLLTDGRQKESQTNSFGIVDQSTAKDFLYRHFGGTIVKENFCTFIQSHKSNSVFDARSVSSVWQDMTQPLPNYLINSQSIQNEAELNRALLDNVRAFLIKLNFVQQDNNDDETILVGTQGKSDITFQKFCEAIRDRGFKKNSFPIIICFPPWENAAQVLTRPREDRVARILNEVLGPMLAKGLMFRGATIRDPEFSPATLRHKVLLMSSQAKLNPFIGLFVADMARTGLGVRVTDVKEQSPAASAGVTKDDWLTRIDQNAIEDKQHLRKCLTSLRIGEEFTVTRENLSHARVVVGAAVDKADPQHATDLSNMLFFNFSSQYSNSDNNNSNSRNGSSQQHQHHHHHKHIAPASAFDSPSNSSSNLAINGNKGSNNNQRNGNNGGGNNNNKNGNANALKMEKETSSTSTAPPTPLSPEPISPIKNGNNNNNNNNNNFPSHAPWETAIVSEDDISKSPKPIDHLALIHLNASPSTADYDDNNKSNLDNSSSRQRNKQQSEESLMNVQDFGAQLVDSHGSRAASQWSRGTFVVNGHCGYVLRDSLTSSTNDYYNSGAATMTVDNNNSSSSEVGNANFTSEWTFKLITLPQEFSNTSVKRVEATVFGYANNTVEATELKDLLLEEEDEDEENNNGKNAAGNKNSNNSNNNNNVASSSAASPIAKALQTLDSTDKLPVVVDENGSPTKSSTSNSPSPSKGDGGAANNLYYNLSTASFCAKTNLSVWKAKIKANRLSRIALTVDFEDGRRIEAVLPANLLRKGPRAVPFRVVDAETKKFPQGASIDVLCSVQRKDLQ